jgi:hypothetical protein
VAACAGGASACAEGFSDGTKWFMGPEWISRAEAGRRLGVSAMAVTNFARSGMPHRFSDGKVPWPDCQYWSDFYRYARNDAERTARERRSARAESWHKARQAGIDAASVANSIISQERAMAARTRLL